MKKTIAAAALALVAVGAAAPAYAGNEKTAICHATGSETNPYTYIEISLNALKQDGHLGHAKDIIPPLSDAEAEAVGIDLPNGQNWNAANQKILEDKCVVSLPPTGAGDYLPLIGAGAATLVAGGYLLRRRPMVGA